MNGEPEREHKLVRDCIPEIIRASGGEPRIRIADGAEYAALLRDKLAEEANEAIAAEAADVTEELADVLEVVYAIADEHGVTRDELESVREAKAAERGGFGGRIVWYRDASPRSAEGLAEQRFVPGLDQEAGQ